MQGMFYKFPFMPCMDLLVFAEMCDGLSEKRLRGHARRPCPGVVPCL